MNIKVTAINRNPTNPFWKSPPSQLPLNISYFSLLQKENSQKEGLSIGHRWRVYCLWFSKPSKRTESADNTSASHRVRIWTTTPLSYSLKIKANHIRHLHHRMATGGTNLWAISIMGSRRLSRRITPVLPLQGTLCDLGVRECFHVLLVCNQWMLRTDFQIDINNVVILCFHTSNNPYRSQCLSLSINSITGEKIFLLKTIFWDYELGFNYFLAKGIAYYFLYLM